MSRAFYIDLRRRLRPWDRLMTWGDSLLSRLISLPQDPDSEAPSHVRTVTEVTPWTVSFVEATWPTVRLGHIHELDPETRIEIGRPVLLHRASHRELRRAWRWAEGNAVRRLQYDVPELLAFFFKLMGITGGDWSHRVRKVCSSHDATIADLMGLPWIPGETSEDRRFVFPQQIRMSRTYECVWRNFEFS
jgi:hypothetical protein